MMALLEQMKVNEVGRSKDDCEQLELWAVIKEK